MNQLKGMPIFLTLIFALAGTQAWSDPFHEATKEEKEMELGVVFAGIGGVLAAHNHALINETTKSFYPEGNLTEMENRVARAYRRREEINRKISAAEADLHRRKGSESKKNVVQELIRLREKRVTNDNVMAKALADLGFHYKDFANERLLYRLGRGFGVGIVATGALISGNAVLEANDVKILSRSNQEGNAVSAAIGLR